MEPWLDVYFHYYLEIFKHFISKFQVNTVTVKIIFDLYTITISDLHWLLAIYEVL